MKCNKRNGLTPHYFNGMFLNISLDHFPYVITQTFEGNKALFDMHLIYFDESGNTGNNLDDTQQPVFVLAALIIPDRVWTNIEQELQNVIDAYFPPPRRNNFEIHGTDIRSGRKDFKDMSVRDRVALRDTWFDIARKHNLKLIYRAIVKSHFQNWLRTFGSNRPINPHVMVFRLVAQIINRYLQELPGKELGIFISDENKEVIYDVEQSIRMLREVAGTLQLDHIIEKGFFIESSKSLMLQLCDLCVLSARKKEEQKAGFPIKSIDESGIAGIESLIHNGDTWYPTTNLPRFVPDSP